MNLIRRLLHTGTFRPQQFWARGNWGGYSHSQENGMVVVTQYDGLYSNQYTMGRKHITNAQTSFRK